MVMDVNIHNHTKTCRKYSTDCRFIFPRYPSHFTIIAQECSHELVDYEKYIFWINVDIILERVQETLKILEDNQISLEDLLADIFPSVKIENEDEVKTIVINVGDKNASFNYLDVIETAEFLCSMGDGGNIDWKKNLGSAVYHFCLTFCRYGTKVILQRDVCEMFVNNYNPHWMEA